MKRIILLTLLCQIAAIASAIRPLKYHRENYRLHDFGIAIGAYLPKAMENDLDGFVMQMRMRYLLDKDDYYGGGGVPGMTINGYYLYSLNDRISVGATIGWNGMSKYELERYDFYKNSDNVWKFKGQAQAKINARAFHLMPTVRYTWFYNSALSLYSKGSIGVYYRYMGFDYSEHGQTIHAPQEDILLAYQVTPLGIDFSDGPVRYFMELGYGAAGIFKIGISCRLHRKWQNK